MRTILRGGIVMRTNDGPKNPYMPLFLRTILGPDYFSFFFLLFFPSHLLSSPFYSLSLLVVTQIRGDMAGSSPPLPTTVRSLAFLSRQDFVYPRKILQKNPLHYFQVIFP